MRSRGFARKKTKEVVGKKKIKQSQNHRLKERAKARMYATSKVLSELRTEGKEYKQRTIRCYPMEIRKRIYVQRKISGGPGGGQRRGKKT